MAIRYYANAGATTLAAPATSGATAIQVTSVTGLPIQYPYVLILDRGTASEEVIEVTAAAGTTLTVTRGVDSTPAFSHATGASVVHGFSARDLREANAHVNATTGVHGTSGSLVGTTGTQTLTGKSINLGTNTITGTKAQFDTACSDANFASLDGAETLTNKSLTDPVIHDAEGYRMGMWLGYTPTFTGTTYEPGSFFTTSHATFTTIHKTVHVSISGTLNIAASTVWSFTLPFPPARRIGQFEILLASERAIATHLTTSSTVNVAAQSFAGNALICTIKFTYERV